MKSRIIKPILLKTGIIVGLSLHFLYACSQETATEKSTDRSESPYFIVLSEDESDNEQLPLKSTQVDVNIAGVIADVTINQVYTNTGKNTIEAIYIFPASTRAAVYNMVMKINDREIVAIVDEKLAARQMYENAKSEGKAASLLEQQRPNVFQMNVANIVPGATIEIFLSYTELLVPNDKIYEFVYPTVVGPRYVSNNEISGATDETWISNPYLLENEKPVSTLDIHLEINAGMSIKDVKCNTHKYILSFSEKNKAVMDLDDKYGGNKDFIVQYRLAGNAIESGVLTYESPEGENYFIVMIQPPQKHASDAIPPREYVFIVDVSGSMSGFPLDISKEIMKNILIHLKPSDKFNIVLFAGGSKIYAENSLPATKGNISLAIEYMNNLSGGGGTELLDALKTAMQLNHEENFSRSFVILTDGYVSVEKEAFDYIRQNLASANFFSFGIGSSVNRLLIEGMAHVGYGESFVALNNDEGKKLAQKFISYISNPLLTNIKASFAGFEPYDILPGKIPDLFSDRPLIITGKYRELTSAKIQIRGLTGTENYITRLELSENNVSINNKAIMYLWAREKIRLLSDYQNLGNDAKTKESIVNLGKQYNLLTDYTSFVAIDSEIINNSGNQITVKQPLPLPEGVSNYAIGYNSLQGNPVGLNRKVAVPVLIKKDEIIYEETDFDLELNDEYAEDAIFVSVEKMPAFKGGDITSFQNYVLSQIVYPQDAMESGIQGTVFVKFTIDENGRLVDIEIIRGISESIDAEVIRILKASPKWIAGEQRGKKVKVSYTIPVKFVLAK